MKGGQRIAVLLAGATLAGVLLALAFGGGASVPALRADLASPGGASAPSVVEPAAVVPASAPTPSPPATPSPARVAMAAVAQVPERPVTGPGSTVYQAVVDGALTRRLQGAHPLRMDGVDMEILGTRLPDESQPGEPQLAVRNVRTGEVAYWQSALRFAVQPGVDPEVFIAQQTDMRRLFVNPELADVAVDAAAISAVYARLSADPRIRVVRLLPILKRPTLR